MDSKTMIYLLVGVTLNICNVRAGEAKCKQPAPIENFSAEKFSGSWFLSAVDIVNKSDMKLFHDVNCGKEYFHLDKTGSKSNQWETDMLLKDKPLYLNGTFYIPDPNKGLLKVNYEARQFLFDMIIMCTDYTNWAAAYFCYQIAPGSTSEYVVFYLRDDTKYNELINTEGLDKCFADINNKPAKDIHKLPFDNCPATNH